MNFIALLVCHSSVNAQKSNKHIYCSWFCILIKTGKLVFCQYTLIYLICSSHLFIVINVVISTSFRSNTPRLSSDIHFGADSKYFALTENCMIFVTPMLFLALVQLNLNRCIVITLDLRIEHIAIPLSAHLETLHSKDGVFLKSSNRCQVVLTFVIAMSLYRFDNNDFWKLGTRTKNCL